MVAAGFGKVFDEGGTALDHQMGGLVYWAPLARDSLRIDDVAVVSIIVACVLSHLGDQWVEYFLKF